MTIGGWIMMLLSVGIVTGLFVSCLWKVLSGKKDPKHLHGFDIDTKDTDSNG